MPNLEPERRIAPRARFQGELKLTLPRHDLVSAKAIATDISTGGIQIRLPAGEPLAALALIGEMVVLEFTLPPHGQAVVRGTIRHKRTESNGEHWQYFYLGIQFVDLPMHIWQSIMGYGKEAGVVSDPPPPAAKPEAAAEPAAVPIYLKEPAAAEEEEEEPPILVSLKLKEGRLVTGRVEGMGFGGFQVRTPEMLEFGETAAVRLYCGGINVVCQGSCAWCHAPVGEAQEYLAGIRIAGIEQDQFERLKELIQKHNYRNEA